MNIGFWLCTSLSIIFLILAIPFAILKEKAAKYVSGFSALPTKKQALYDKELISRDMRNRCFIWMIIMFVGAILSYVLSPYMAIPAFLIWLILFFKDVHFDAHKAFEKYLKPRR